MEWRDVYFGRGFKAEGLEDKLVKKTDSRVVEALNHSGAYLIVQAYSINSEASCSFQP
jgi:hypothetical protein